MVERALAGALLLSDDAALDVRAAGLLPAHFADKALAEVCRIVFELLHAGAALDLVTVASRLPAAVVPEVGAAAFLADVCQSCIGSCGAAEWTEAVIEASRRRKLADLGRRLVATAGDPASTSTADSLVESTRKDLDAVLAEGGAEAGTSLADAAGEAIKAAWMASQAGSAGVSTGIPSLDALVGGIRPGTLIVLAARTGVGKSAFASQQAANLAIEAREEVLFFSLEMSALELAGRILARRAKVPVDRLVSGKCSSMDIKALEQAKGDIASASLTFHDDVTALDKIVATARRAALRGRLGLIVVDYLQLVHGPRRQGAARHEEIAAISRGFKQLARELDVPVLALSQLSRAVEQRGSDKAPARPMLSDLRESGSIEQDADVVLFLHDETKPQDRKDIGVVDLIVAKNRAGRVGTVPLVFARHYQGFCELRREAAAASA